MTYACVHICACVPMLVARVYVIDYGRSPLHPHYVKHICRRVLAPSTLQSFTFTSLTLQSFTIVRWLPDCRYLAHMCTAAARAAIWAGMGSS